MNIHIAATESGLCMLAMAMSNDEFHAELGKRYPSLMWKQDTRHPVLLDTENQLKAYFQGELKAFDVPLDLHGTKFQLKVWNALQSIPYGETRSYGDVARSIGSPKASRAVGGAVGGNPVGIIVPCHRVIASDGSLGGFGCGLPMKIRLLKLESSAAKRPSLDHRFSPAAACG